LVGGAAPGLALDGQQAPANSKAPLPLFKSPQQAQKRGLDLYRAGNFEASVDALKYAADGGQQIAQWKLGQMYASGDGVGRDDVKAYQYFKRIIDSYNEDDPDQWDIRFVANAFVAIGVYSLTGIPTSSIKRDLGRAFEMFQYAAMNFGDSDAQFNLARMYLDGIGVRKDARQAIKWLSVAAEKNHMESQALLGHLLFTGEDGRPRQRARGLMLLTLARDAATGSKKDAWIIDYYNADMQAANEIDREMALKYLDGRLRGVAAALPRR
jgi:TPR repeat protein